MYFLLLVFVITIFVALRNERRVLKTPSSPLFIVVTFNMIILALYYITAKPLGFHQLCFSTLIVLLYGCFLFACVSLFFYYKRNVKVKTNNYNKIQYVDEYPSKLVISISYFTIAFMILRMLAIGINNIVDDEDSAALFGSGGLSGHVLVLQIFLTTHLIGRRLSFYSILAIVGLFFCLFIYNVKAWIIIPFIIGWFIRRDLMAMKLNPIILVFVPLVIFAIFTTSYMVSLGWEVDNMNFIWAHFCKYVYAGIGGLNESLIHHYPIGNCPWYGTPSFIGVFTNVNTQIPSIYDYVVINDLNGEYTNVYSLFGGAYLFNGPFIGTFYLVIIAVISNKLYMKRLKTNNYWLYFSYYLWSSGLVLSFFGNYYTLLNIWELTAEAYIIGLWHKTKLGNLT